jgi:hypothetical protein
MQSMIRRGASLLLGISFFLPLTRCSGVGGTPVDIAGYSAYSWPSIGAMIACVVFFWPIAIHGFLLRYPDRFSAPRLRFAELVLCIFSAAGISWLVFWGHSVRYGAFVSYAAVAVYASSVLRDVVGSSNHNQPFS